MKTYLFATLLSFLYISSTAQDSTKWDCSEYTETIIDKMSGDSSRWSKQKIYISPDDKEGLLISAGSFNGNTCFILNIEAYGGKSNCIDKGAEINFLFVDGSRFTLYNEAKFNCDNSATLYFGDVFGQQKEFDKLTSVEVETIRAWKEDGYVQVDLSPKQRKDLIRVLLCLQLGL